MRIHTIQLEYLLPLLRSFRPCSFDQGKKMIRENNN